MKFHCANAREIANKLAVAIDGDVIAVRYAAAKELAERAMARLCPELNIQIEIEEEE